MAYPLGPQIDLAPLLQGGSSDKLAVDHQQKSELLMVGIDGGDVALMGSSDHSLEWRGVRLGDLRLIMAWTREAM